MRKKKGQAILEVALALPVILLLFCGMVDFGRVLQASTHLNMVSQEAVRIAGLGGSDSEIKSFINNEVILKDKDKISVIITPNSYNRESGDYVTVKISYPVSYITPLMNVILPSPYVVDTQSTIRVE